MVASVDFDVGTTVGGVVEVIGSLLPGELVVGVTVGLFIVAVVVLVFVVVTVVVAVLIVVSVLVELTGVSLSKIGVTLS